MNSDHLPLECRNVERWLSSGDSRTQVLQGVSLKLEKGKVYSIVGPSGCGKSSLLYLLGLLDAPDAGEIQIQGRHVGGLSEEELSQTRNEFLGFIFQFHFLMKDFTALENVMVPMRRLGRLPLPQMEERALMLLGQVGLGGKAGRLSTQLSGGEQQRVAIARALANGPAIILADEPTGNLDSVNSERVFQMLKSIVREENRTLLLVTHNPAIAEASDWVFEMRDGKILREHCPNPQPA
jgi:lipoprotein-releasing system ATP-binding protein